MKDYVTSLSPNAERRFYEAPVGFEKREDGVDENVIEGYAAVFNKDSEDFGGWVERIAPGAFSDVLKDNAVALFNHDMNYVLGRNGVNVTLSEDQNGLKYTIKLPDTSFAKDLRQLIKDGIIHQSSFAFTVKEQRWTKPTKEGERHVRTIDKIKRLYDVSPVTTPAYPDASVGARSFSELEKEQPLTADLIDFTIKIKQR
jgi:HK97 family phage prohead protease